jgi:xanthine/uracil/vitamin C permease (AzgA family)
MKGIFTHLFTPKMAIVTGVLGTTFLSFLFNVTPAPVRWIGVPPDVRPLLLKLDLSATLSLGFFPIILTIFVMAFVDTVGTLIGLSARAGLLDEKGTCPISRNRCSRTPWPPRWRPFLGRRPREPSSKRRPGGMTAGIISYPL